MGLRLRPGVSGASSGKPQSPLRPIEVSKTPEDSKAEKYEGSEPLEDFKVPEAL